MSFRLGVTVCGVVAFGAGCSLRMELPGSEAGTSAVNLPDSGSGDLARPGGDASPAQASGGNTTPSGSGEPGGASSATGGAAIPATSAIFRLA